MATTPLNQKSLAIVDFDGTLADSAGWLFEVLNEAARRHGFRETDEAERRSLRGLDSRAVMAALGIPAWKVPLIARDLRRLAARRVAEDACAIPLFPGALDLMAGLRERGWRIAVVSSNGLATIRTVLGPAAGTVDLYETGTSLMGKAARFRRVLRRTGATAAAAVAIGDEVRDIEAAKAAGIDCIAVTWGLSTPAALREAGATTLAETMDGLAELLIGAPAAIPVRECPSGRGGEAAAVAREP